MILISYRRNDATGLAGRIYDRLKQHYGDDRVFFDIATVPIGADFRVFLDEKLAACEQLISIVGKNWLETDKDQKPRIFSENDWVRLELESAFNNKIPIIPVLIYRTRMPGPEELPQSLSQFAFLQCLRVDAEADFEAHMDKLIDAIEVNRLQQREMYALGRRLKGGSGSSLLLMLLTPFLPIAIGRKDSDLQREAKRTWNFVLGCLYCLILLLVPLLIYMSL